MPSPLGSRGRLGSPQQPWGFRQSRDQCAKGFLPPHRAPEDQGLGTRAGPESSPKLVSRYWRQQGLTPQHQQGPLGPAQDLHTALNLGQEVELKRMSLSHHQPPILRSQSWLWERVCRALPGGEPGPGKGDDLPVGGMPGGCPAAGALQAEAPKPPQTGWPGNSLSTCEEEWKQPITRVHWRDSSRGR